jgi:hypothetical protein
MSMKRRALFVHDGPRRLCKDDMMLHSELEVRLPLGNGRYVTDLDKLTLDRANGIHAATEEERGPWDPEADSAEVDIAQLMS